MTIYLPGPDEPGVFGPPLATDEAAPPAPRPEVASALERLQARDDALFVATSLADLFARHGAALRQAETDGFAAEDPSRLDGFSARQMQALDAEVEDRIGRAGGGQGARPSDAALDLFRRQAGRLRQDLLARAALGENALNRHAQSRSVLAAVDGLAGLVAADADALDHAQARLGAVTAAAAPLFGDDTVVRLYEHESRRLAEAAVRGLIGRDPDEALERLAGGDLDDRLDNETKARLAGYATARKAALVADNERAAQDATLADERDRAARAYGFARDWRRRLEEGGASLAELADAEADGVIAPAQAARLRTGLAVADRRRLEESSLVARAAAALDADGAFDPASGDDRAAVEAHYRAVLLPGLGDKPTPMVVETISDYVAATGIAPREAIRALVGSIFGPVPEERVRAARVLGGCLGADPQAQDHLPFWLRESILRSLELADAGLPAAEVARPLDDAVPSMRDMLDRPERPDRPDRDGPPQWRRMPNRPGRDDGPGSVTALAAETDRAQMPATSEPTQTPDGGDREPTAPRGGAGESDRNNAGPVLVAGPGHNPSSSAVEEADDLFRRYRDNLRPREGGFADRPTDRGGPTNEGISQRTVDDLRERPEWRYLPERSADLSDEKIDEIYRKEYFDRPQIDKLQRVPGLSDSAPQLPEQIFDAGILHGTDAAGRWLQEALDEVTGSDLRVRNSNKSSHYDGIIGSRTREALRRAVKRGQARNINNRVVEKRRSHMEDLVHRAPDQRENLRGWLGRAEMFRIR